MGNDSGSLICFVLFFLLATWKHVLTTAVAVVLASYGIELSFAT